MSENDTKIAGRLAIALSAVFCIASIAIPVANRFLTKPIDIGLDVSLPYIIGVLALFTTYVYGRTEHAIERQEYLLSQPLQGVELFTTSDALLKRLSELTVGASTVSTINLSSPLGQHLGLDKYFVKVHQDILDEKSELQSFRSLASVDSYHKLEWIVQRAVMLFGSGKASLAVLRQVKVGSVPLGFHIVMRGSDGYVFFYPPVDLTGQMRAFLIKNKQVADVALHYFDALWVASPVVTNGKVPSLSGLEFLATIDQRIKSNQDFQKLLALAE